MPPLKCILESLVHKTVFTNNLSALNQCFKKMEKIRKKHIHTGEIRLDSATKPGIIPTRQSVKLKEKATFRFTDYDCIGFDLDNTICRYKIGAMAKLEYETMSRFLVDQKGYPSKHLLKPFEDSLDFLIKGLIIDGERGNLLRIGTDGIIHSGSHGTRHLTKQELIEYYGPQCRWQATDLFSRDPLHTWNGPYSERMRTLLDYFDLPAGLVFARAVDSVDDAADRKVEKYTIWLDLLDALIDMFQKEHFQLDKGGYFPEMKANPDKYIHKCSNNLVNWFLQLKAKNKTLFLITGSNVDFASHTASNTLGPNWRDLFDIVVCFAKKPGFFTGNRKFIGLDGLTETGPVKPKDLQSGQIYTYGNFNDLYRFLEKHNKKTDPKVLYVGDNLIQDVYTPSVHTVCDTVAIVEELQAEGVFGHHCDHVDQLYIVSEAWGSYFGRHEEHSFWRNIIQKHSKLCIPSLEYVASKPLDHPYSIE